MNPTHHYWVEPFLEILATTANVTVSANQTGIDRATAYRRKHSDEVFKQRWEEAIEEAVDLLEGEARRRAAVGVDEPVYYKGKIVGEVKKYSDRLLIVLLKAHRPAKYRENFSMTHSGKIDHGQPEPFKIEIVQAPQRDKEPPTGAAVDAGSQDQGDVKPASDA